MKKLFKLILSFASLFRREQLYFCNDGNIQTHSDGIVSRTTDAALGRYRLVKVGTSPLTSVAVTGTSDLAIGVTLDETANTTDLTGVRLLAVGAGTIRMTSDGTAAIAVGDELVAGTSGGVKTIAAGAGNYIVVGRALTSVLISATGDDAILEVAPCQSYRTK